MMSRKQLIWRFIGAAVFLAVVLGGATLFSKAASAANTTYYINNQSGSNCSDAGSGTSPSAPWCSFTPVNNIGTFGAGDQILLARGATFNQQMVVTGSGTSNNWITIGAYGTGSRPKIARNGHESDRAIRLTDPDFWKIQDLEISDAGTGILVSFTTAGHQGLKFERLYLHDIKGIHQGSGSGDLYTGDGIWNSAGIEITSTTWIIPPPTVPFIKDIMFDYIEGTRNLDTISIDWANGSYPGYVEWDSGHQSAENVILNHIYIHDTGNGGLTSGCDDGMRFTYVKNMTMMNSIVDGQAKCHSDTGTAAVYIAFTYDSQFTNSIFTNVPDTNSGDMVAFDYECCTTNVQINNSFIAYNARAGISYLGIYPTQPHGDNSNSLAAGNMFINNTLGGSFMRTGDERYPTGTIRDNLYHEPNEFLYKAWVNFTFSGYTVTNNKSIDAEADMYNAGYQFSGTQGSNSWSYQSYNGSSWSNLGYYDAATKSWQPSSGTSVPRVTQFEQYPDSCSNCKVARAWTAPKTGTISIRGRILKSDLSGGDGVVARITRNGTQIWPASGGQSVSYNELAGIEQVLDGLTVSAGDVIRFEVDSGASNNNTADLTSWAPSIAYTSSTVTAPSAPTGLTATGGNAQVALSWTAASGATSYTVKRGTTSGTYGTTVASGVTGTSYTDTTVTNGTTYYYVVTATNSAGTSGNSSQASATPNVSVPSAPTGLTANGGNAQVALSWTAASGATSYTVKRGTTSGTYGTTVASGVTGTSYTDTTVTNGTTYYYVVTATNSAGTSGNSTEASATPSSGSGSYAKEWNFNTDGDHEGWGVAYDMGTSVSGGYLNIISWGTNPFIHSPDGLGVSASANGHVYVKMSNSSSNTSGKIYFTTTSSTNFDESKAVAFTVQASIGQTVYDVNMSVNANWTGTIKQIRFDPIEATGNLAVDYIKIGNNSGTSAPSAPTGLTATGGNAQVALSWTASSGATSYTVKRGTTSGTYGTTVASGVTGTSYTDTTVTNGTTYYYVVTATNSGGTSGNSSEASATPAAGGGSIAVEWNFNTDGNLENWWLANDIGGTVSGGSLNLTSYGTDPYMYSPDHLDVSASANGHVYIRMKNNTSQTTAQVLFSTTADPTFGGAKYVTFNITPNSGYVVYDVNVGANAAWTGTIRRIRLDPLDMTGTVEIDYIKIGN